LTLRTQKRGRIKEGKSGIESDDKERKKESRKILLIENKEVGV